MSLKHLILCAAGAGALAAAAPASASTFLFNGGLPDGKLGALSRPGGVSLETETGDDFVLNRPTTISRATFTGLVPDTISISDVSNVVVEIYRVFPKDSNSPPSGNVPTRTNSPSDVAFDSRDGAASELTFNAQIIANAFTVSNSVVNGIHPSPGEFTGGEGPVSGHEMLISVDLASPFTLPADHYFFVPQVQLTNGDFLWLSAPKPIVPPGTSFVPDLQAWIRNEDLAPDWLRIGTDITHQGPFNMAFTLEGDVIPEPSEWTLLIAGMMGVGLVARRGRRGAVSPPA